MELMMTPYNVVERKLDKKRTDAGIQRSFTERCRTDPRLHYLFDHEHAVPPTCSSVT